MSNISFSEDAWEDYLYWQLQDKKTLKKINELLKEIQRTPFSGKGEPEKLRAGDLVREIAKLAGGGGGGRPDSAMAGAKDISKLDGALAAVEQTVKSLIK